MDRYRIVVYSSVFPSSARPTAGLFVRERMFRLAPDAEIVVVAPVPWFPGQGLLRLLRPGYRPQPPLHEQQSGITVHFPRFLAVPGLLRSLDARLMAWCTLRLLRRLQREWGAQLIDSHFSYPDGWAATWLGRKLGLPVTITLRGTETPHSRDRRRRAQLLQAWARADRLFAVSDSLRRLAVGLGAEAAKFTVVGNGVDSATFRPLDRAAARAALDIPAGARVLVTVGGLVERKGFHRVIACLPELARRHGEVVYLVVGGASAEGDYGPQLRALAAALGVSAQVRFLGPLAPAQLPGPLSAADAFVLASSNEGWANVILEAMACGTPVIATDVGGNREVVADDRLGAVVPFGDHDALLRALDAALAREWDAQALIAYAGENSWESRIALIRQVHGELLASQ